MIGNIFYNYNKLFEILGFGQYQYVKNNDMITKDINSKKRIVEIPLKKVQRRV